MLLKSVFHKQTGRVATAPTSFLHTITLNNILFNKYFLTQMYSNNPRHWSIPVRHGFNIQTLVDASICQNNRVYRLTSIALMGYSTRQKRFQTGALGVRKYNRFNKSYLYIIQMVRCSNTKYRVTSTLQ